MLPFQPDSGSANPLYYPGKKVSHPYLDLQSNPGSIYAIVGDGIHATVIPSFDEAGRLSFAVFSGGKEASWSDVLSTKRDFKARIIRVPPASS